MILLDCFLYIDKISMYCTSENIIFSSSPKSLLSVVLVDHFVYLLAVYLHKKFDGDLLLRTEAIGYVGLMWSLVARH